MSNPHFLAKNIKDLLKILVIETWHVFNVLLFITEWQVFYEDYTDQGNIRNTL